MNDLAFQELVENRPVGQNCQEAGVLSDDIVILGRPGNKKTRQIRVRRIKLHDAELNRNFTFITNDLGMAARQIADIYKRRWQIELLFKRLKQNYALYNFLGDNENAIRIQIWCTLIADLLLKVVSGKLNRKWAFSNLASIAGMFLMHYLHLFSFLNNPEKYLLANRKKEKGTQLMFFT